MNAQDMFEAIQKSQVCEGLDEWIKDTLYPRMRQSPDLIVRFNERTITWSRYDFIRDMERLGYRMEWDCEDRPCSEPYYTISIRNMESPR